MERKLSLLFQKILDSSLTWTLYSKTQNSGESQISSAPLGILQIVHSLRHQMEKKGIVVHGVLLWLDGGCVLEIPSVVCHKMSSV